MFKSDKSLLKDSFFDNINNCSLDLSQRKVLVDKSDNLLVVAGAGSGKTLTIIGKIKYLIMRENIDYRDILCISFTNETVNNLKKKVGYDIDCYTFHKLGLRILKEMQYDYHIVPSDTLEYLVNEYFECDIKNNNLLSYVLDYFDIILKQQVSYEEIISIYQHQFNLYKRNIISFIMRIKCNNHSLNDIKNYFVLNLKYKEEIRYKNKCFLIIVLDIYSRYMEELHSVLGIDFDDMLSISKHLVEERGMYHNYKYIIIDEFQDTSFVRYQLIHAIQVKTKARVMCVGDDYQSIYAFSGCNLDLFINFKKYFNKARILYINKTYRNCYEIVNTSCSFIKKNPYQLKKKIRANFLMKNSMNIVYYYQNNYREKFYKLLDYLIDNNITKILVLGRNNRDIYELVTHLDNSSFCYRDVLIRYLTVHRSKGLEEECVILINANDAFLGFPNKIMDNMVFDLISAKKEKIPYAEERRLFYVAMTRPKKYLYILSDIERVSPFVLEIINKLHEVSI